MISVLSLVTSVKDYVEIVHKLIETDSNFKITNYSDLGPIITYTLITLKEFFFNIISLNWLKTIWDLPVIIPDISSAMISEISVLDGYFHNAFNFLDNPISYGDTNIAVYSLEKFSIGLINSIFLCIPTGTSHLITLRRFVMQGLEAGYLAGLGSICGNILWIGSIILGCRFFVIPWLSLDIFRYLLGFVLLVKYMWDSYNEKKIDITTTSAKQKIFLLNFLLALTEQTSIYPFISNISIGSESSLLESFPAQNYLEFFSIHGSYILGLTLGCFSLLHFTCWFWENPAFKIYMWVISSFKISTNFYYKALNFTFLYLTMICAISSIPYYGLDYTLTNPLGFVQDDRILDQKLILETSFLNTKASDRNTRRNRGRHGRRERWKRRIRKYRTFDASLYDQGIYDLFTIEDLNYGFDRFWLRRKMRNHRVRFRFFPGPWMRSFKKQLAKPRLESYAGPRQEFFRILFEQVYHPSFHEYNVPEGKSQKNKNLKTLPKLLPSSKELKNNSASALALNETNFSLLPKKAYSVYYNNMNSESILEKMGQGQKNAVTENKIEFNSKENLKIENSTLRKFVRKINNRIKSSEIKSNFKNVNLFNKKLQTIDSLTISGKKLNKDLTSSKDMTNRNFLYSKRWKQIFSKLSHDKEQVTGQQIQGQLKGLFKNFYQTSLNEPTVKKENSKINLSKQDKQILKYRSILTINKQAKVSSIDNLSTKEEKNISFTFLHPLKFYLKKQEAFERKLRYYTPTLFRKFSIENNAPYFRVMMKRYFYYFKPTLRWERTMKVASLRKARRKTSASPRKIQFTEANLKNLTQNSTSSIPLISNNIAIKKEEKNNPNLPANSLNQLETNKYNMFKRKVQATHNYTIVGKRASRFRYEIYKDVLQHWYYSPFNRLLLKFDIDLFIKRQPNSHFLTKNEENLLHLRRFLLSEHYNTLRWYSYMQHYRSMKTKIGGTKSFASKVYNQQFTGTFKKIRHLFAITPSQSNQSVLKFDQPLYNESFNNSKNNLQKNLIIHEELLDELDGQNFKSDTSMSTLREFNGQAKQTPTDLLNQSTQVIRTYLKNTNPIKEEYIKNLIENKDYLKLTQFLYKGKKTRGLKPITNERNLLNQEKEYLLTDIEKEELKNLEKIKLNKMLRPLQQDLWINLLKKWKRKINDQEFLKNYLQRRIEKREKRKQKKEKNLKIKLERLENWLSFDNQKNDTNLDISLSKVQTKDSPTTGINNALIEGVSTLKNKGEVLKTQKPQQRANFAQKLNWLQQPNSSKFNIRSLDNSTNSSSLTNLKNTSFIKKEKELNYSIENLTKIIKDLEQTESTIYLKLKNKLSLKNLNLRDISFKIKNIYQKYKYNSSKFIKTKLINIFKPILPRRKNLKNWQQKERSLNKQKRSRKEFKIFSKKPFQIKNKNYLKYLDQKSDLPLNNQGNLLERKKRDFSTTVNNNEITEKSNWKNIIKETYIKYFSKKFKRKKSPQRRARIRRNRGVTKKRTLSDSLKREFKNLRKYGEKMDNKKQKIVLSFSSSINQELSVDGIFKQSPLQRRSKQKKQRFWKQKRSKYSQKLRKYKKRRRSVLGKVRILNKQLKRIQSTTELKNWWWKNFLPNLRATTDSLLQFEKDRQIQQKLLELTIPEILERDQFNNFKDLSPNNMLQIGDFDFKPLSMPEAIKLRENLLKEKNIVLNKQSIPNSQELNGINKLEYSSKINIANLPVKEYTGKNASITNLENQELSNDIISKISQTSLSALEKRSNSTNNPSENKKQIFSTNTIPFYAGWDESLRKFVVTNRLLSRRSSGYEMDIQEKYQNENMNPDNNKTWFSDAPLKGMNAATTLYWQIPFTTYDPDQFFALGMDGFAPLGWRRFQFRHSILKSWLYEKTMPQNSTNSKNTYIIKNKTNILNNTNNIFETSTVRKNNNSQLIYKLNQHLSGFTSKGNDNLVPSGNNIFIDKKFTKFSNKNGTVKNIYRRLKKRYKRVKKHPRSPVWFPSGPLLNQVLPVHYIYIFYKRSRLPRDRYIKRRLRKLKTVPVGRDSSNASKEALLISSKNDFSTFKSTGITDFTLRKRIKTKRKYHIKKDLNKKYPLIPRRMKFIGEDSSTMRWRPLSRQKINKPIAELIKEQRALKYKQRKKDEAARGAQGSSAKQTSNLRVKQLRRRVQRQIIRSVWRYRPRAGGFVWPGDYLKLEQVKAPKLNSSEARAFASTDSNKINNLRSSSIKVKRKKKRNIQEWQIQPKKYLLEKHNSNSIKRKLEKANRSNKMRERINELNLIL